MSVNQAEQKEKGGGKVTKRYKKKNYDLQCNKATTNRLKNKHEDVYFTRRDLT